MVKKSVKRGTKNICNATHTVLLFGNVIFINKEHYDLINKSSTLSTIVQKFTPLQIWRGGGGDPQCGMGEPGVNQSVSIVM